MKDQLIARLNESMNSSWHGPSILQLTKDLDFQEAISKPIPHRHSIWEIIEHVSFWLDMVNQVLNGRKHPEIGELDDWPIPGETPEEYENSITTMCSRLDALIDSINTFDKGFNENITPDDFTYGWMLQGICNHNLYHSGQIILLRISNP